MGMVLFDFDGVIVDSFAISYQSTLATIDNPPDVETYRGFFDGNIYDAGDIPKENRKIDLGEENPFFKEYIPRMLESRLFPGIQDVLIGLGDDFRKSIVSSTISSPIDRYLSAHDLRRYFDRIYGADVELNKSKKIQMAIEEFGIPAEKVVFVTDTLGDIREASRVNVPSVAVTWGFHDANRLKQGEPAALVSDSDQLLQSIKALLK